MHHCFVSLVSTSPYKVIPDLIRGIYCSLNVFVHNRYSPLLLKLKSHFCSQLAAVGRSLKLTVCIGRRLVWWWWWYKSNQETEVILKPLDESPKLIQDENTFALKCFWNGVWIYGGSLIFMSRVTNTINHGHDFWHK